MQFQTQSPAETKELAAQLAASLQSGDLLILTGDLGAGKTCFTQGIGLGLGISDPITSPTFALHQVYEGRLTLNHLDVYRLDDLAETLDLDLPELMEEGVTVIEWGEQISPVLPSEHLTLRILLDPENNDSRTLQFEASGQRFEDLVASLVRSS